MTIIIWILFIFPPFGYRKSQFRHFAAGPINYTVDTSEEREKVSPISQSDVSGLSAALMNRGTCRLTFFHTHTCVYVSTDQWPPSPSV